MKNALLIAGAVVATGLTAGVMTPVKPAAAGDSLAITSWGGAYQMSQRKAFFEPYAKATGTKITEEEYNGEIAKIKAMVDSKSVSWDVIDEDSGRSIQGCAEGVLETIDWSKL